MYIVWAGLLRTGSPIRALSLNPIPHLQFNSNDMTSYCFSWLLQPPIPEIFPSSKGGSTLLSRRLLGSLGHGIRVPSKRFSRSSEVSLVINWWRRRQYHSLESPSGSCSVSSKCSAVNRLAASLHGAFNQASMQRDWFVRRHCWAVQLLAAIGEIRLCRRMEPPSLPESASTNKRGLTISPY